MEVKEEWVKDVLNNSFVDDPAEELEKDPEPEPQLSPPALAAALPPPQQPPQQQQQSTVNAAALLTATREGREVDPDDDHQLEDESESDPDEEEADDVWSCTVSQAFPDAHNAELASGLAHGPPDNHDGRN